MIDTYFFLYAVVLGMDCRYFDEARARHSENKSSNLNCKKIFLNITFIFVYRLKKRALIFSNIDDNDIVIMMPLRYKSNDNFQVCKS